MDSESVDDGTDELKYWDKKSGKKNDQD